MAAKLTAEERAVALTSLPGWTYDAGRDALLRDFKFKDFSEAFAFMTRVALLAQAADHHPEWSNVYNKVSIALSTHDAGGVSAKDTALAAAIDQADHLKFRPLRHRRPGLPLPPLPPRAVCGNS